MLPRKSKPEGRALPAWLTAFVGPLHLDFVAPYPLEETTRLLKAQKHIGFRQLAASYPVEVAERLLHGEPHPGLPRLGGSLSVRVNLARVDADTFAFSVKKYGSLYATTEAHGHLKRWDQGTTHVTGRVNATPYQYWVYLPIVFFTTMCCMVLTLRYWWIMLLLFSGIMMISWVVMRYNRYDVAHLIEQALDADLSEDDKPIKWGT